MKAIAFLATLLLTCSIAHADTVALVDTSCINSSCLNPAPDVNWVSVQFDFKSAAVSFGGSIYVAGSAIAATTSTTPDGITYADVTAVLTNTDGAQIMLVAKLKKWRTAVRNGRANYYVQHIELLGGAITF